MGPLFVSPTDWKINPAATASKGKIGHSDVQNEITETMTIVWSTVVDVEIDAREW